MGQIPGWWGVDLDGTLAHYDTWIGEDHIGEPIGPMVERVKSWLEEGRDVRILTARMCPGEGRSPEICRKAIEEWCREHLGQVLPVCYEKDYMMVQLWDDRAVQVIPNTGIRADYSKLAKEIIPLLDDGELIELKALFDAKSSIVFDELMRRALAREGK